MKRFFYSFFGVVLLLCLSFGAKAQPTANFSANTLSGCTPLVVQFNDLSTGNPTSWYWDLGNGAYSTLQNPSTTYLNPGPYTVTLTVYNAGGSNTKTITSYINVIPSPIVDFTGDTTLTCIPKTVNFTSQVVPGVPGNILYSWDFGDGFTSNLANPSHTYNVAGNYTVTLIATNSAGCNKSMVKSQYIHVVNKPQTSFTVTNSASCVPPLTSTFNNTTTGAVSYQWDFGDNTAGSTATSPTHNYTTPGIYTVRLIATSPGGCSDTLLMPAAVTIANPVAAFTPGTACIGSPVAFTNTSIPAASAMSWDFGDGFTASVANPTHTYAGTGTFPVKLVVHQGNCADSVTHNVSVSPKPVPQFTGTPLTACSAPHTVNFTSTSTGAVSYLWKFGDGDSATTQNPSHTYNAVGSYTVKLYVTSAAGCTDSLIQTSYVQISQPSVIIASNPSAACAPATISFQAFVYSAFPAASYNWTFGDGGTGTGATTSHLYTTPGTYTVTVSGLTTTGCPFSQTINTQITAKPVSAFTATPTFVCVNQPVTFTSTNTNPNYYYTWIFGDGNVYVNNSASSVVSTYSAPGTYTVTLITYNGYACFDSLTIPNMITVIGPTAKFIPVLNCANRKQVTFNNISTGATGYHWDFGDGFTSNAFSPTHTYANYGVYNVTLTDTAGSCINEKHITLDLFPLLPSFTSSDTTLCAGDSTTFTPAPNTHQLSYDWYFGDNTSLTTSSAVTVSHLYPNPGQYTVKLVIRDTNNCKDSLVRTNYIKVSGFTKQVTATPAAGCSPLAVNFTDATTTSNGATITGRTWYFGDNSSSTSNTATLSHTYFSQLPITYTPKLVYTNSYGCTDSINISTVTIARPHAAFTCDTQVCKGATVPFINSSSGATAITYQWTFGDNTAASSAGSPTHIYNATGTYIVRLIVTDASGCKDTMTRTLYVSQVYPAFTMSDTAADCPPLLVNFTNNTPGVNTYLWSFGNNNTSTLANPSTLYVNPGIFAVKLIVTNAYGCKDSITKNVTLTGPAGTFSYTPLGGCVPLSVQFNANATFTQTYYWDMNNGTTVITTGNSTTFTYTQPGNYVPVLILSSGANCSRLVQGTDTIKINGVTGNFSFPNQVYCKNSAVQFTDTVYASQPANPTRYWIFGDGFFSTAHNPSHIYATPGTYNVKLVLSNSSGCHDTITHQLVIRNTPPVYAGANTAICNGSTTTLQASGASTYTWYPATGLSCTNCASPVASPATTTTYNAIGIDTNGCRDTAHIVVTVNPIPSVSASPNASICSGYSTPLTATGATGGYVWTPAAGLSCTNCANPVASPTTTTAYVVTGTSAGCSDTGQVTVTVNQSPVLTLSPNVTICNGASAQLNVSGAASYSWTPAAGLSCTTCNNPVASPLTTTTYTVTGTNSNGCVSTAQVTVAVTSLPPVSAGANQAICNGDSAQLNASGATSYVWTPAAGLSCTNCQNPFAHPSATTTYTVTGTIAGGCQNTSSVTVTVNTPPLTNAGADTAICTGAAANLHATGATNYSWTPSTGLSCTSCANPVATPAATTAYIVTGANGVGCSRKDTIVVTVMPLPSISAGANQTICLAASATLQATGGVSYTWSPNTNISCTSCASPVVSPAATTTYTVIGTGANTCTNTSQVTVTLYPQPPVNAGVAQSICAGGSVNLQASGAVSYVWSPSAGLSCTTCASPVATPAATTTYKVIGTSANSCKDSSTVTVTVNPLPNVNAGPDTSICIGTSANLHATGAVNYSWTPSTGLSCTNCSNPVATPAATTTYIVTGTNGINCSQKDTIIVTVMPRPTISAGANQTICLATSATLQATGGVSYNWSPNTNISCVSCASPVVSPTATTTYTVIGTGANTCTNTSQVTVSLYAQPPVSAGAAQSICAGNSASLQASGAVSYVWSPSAGLSCTTCANPVATPAATTTYKVIGTSVNGCKDSSTVTITVNPLPNVSAGANQTICSGLTTNLQATGASAYVWSPATGLSCTNCASPIASPAATTTYTVTGTSAAGCTGTAQVTVTVIPSPTVTAGANQLICKGASAQLQAGGAVSYVWSPAAGLSCTNCANPVCTPAAPATYTVTGTSANGCINTSQVQVNFYTPPAISAGPDQTICRGKSASLQASGGVSYAWSPAATLSCGNCPNPLASPLTNLTYKVVGTDVNNCRDSDEVVVNVIQKLPTEIAGDVSICKGETAQLHASGGLAYSWSPAATLNNSQIADPKATPDVTTRYIVVIKQNQCFDDTLTQLVTVHPLPTVNLGQDKTIFAGESINLFANSTNANLYAWSPPDGLSCTDCVSPVASPEHTTTYVVVASNQYGCKASDDIKITLKCDGSMIFVPNTFTPNADGQNDRFFPHGRGGVTIEKFRVFDRWGEVVFDMNFMPVNDPASGWDGTFKGVALKPDVYVYLLQARCVTGDVIELKGDVSLVR